MCTFSELSIHNTICPTSLHTFTDVVVIISLLLTLHAACLLGSWSRLPFKLHEEGALVVILLHTPPKDFSPPDFLLHPHAGSRRLPHTRCVHARQYSCSHIVSLSPCTWKQHLPFLARLGKLLTHPHDRWSQLGCTQSHKHDAKPVNRHPCCALPS
jgi:hypothetical protein